VSEWTQQKPGHVFHGYCPGCGAHMYFAEKVACPELLKCLQCGAEWLVIKLPKEEQEK
jgi:hypothetical protein